MSHFRFAVTKADRMTSTRVVNVRPTRRDPTAGAVCDQGASSRMSPSGCGEAGPPWSPAPCPSAPTAPAVALPSCAGRRRPATCMCGKLYSGPPRAPPLFALNRCSIFRLSAKRVADCAAIRATKLADCAACSSTMRISSTKLEDCIMLSASAMLLFPAGGKGRALSSCAAFTPAAAALRFPTRPSESCDSDAASSTSASSSAPAGASASAAGLSAARRARGAASSGEACARTWIAAPSLNQAPSRMTRRRGLMPAVCRRPRSERGPAA
mmetsp:Transcript_89791/g.231825  ORF Transcript_89791/g.231825 Transcript_89791/m.231825 type:complete len:269 (-) Transcript_89791:143-949(-)